MNEQLGESLSALMDGEAGSVDLDRVLENVSDPALRDAWRRYHGARDSLEPGASFVNLDMSGRIMAALESEPTYSQSAAAPGDDPRAAAAAIRPVGRFEKFLRPVASFAVAASVTAAVLLGSQYYGLLDTGASAIPASRDIAENTGQSERGSPVTLLGGTATLAGYGYAVPAQAQPEAASATDYDAIARERLRRYMLPHAEEASLNSPQGMMPYAKVATFGTEE